MLHKSEHETYLTEQQLMDRWNVGKKTLADMRKDRRLSFVKPNGLIKYRLSEVLRHESSRETNK